MAKINSIPQIKRDCEEIESFPDTFITTPETIAYKEWVMIGKRKDTDEVQQLITVRDTGSLGLQSDIMEHINKNFYNLHFYKIKETREFCKVSDEAFNQLVKDNIKHV